jgi:DUF2946 family protein
VLEKSTVTILRLPRRAAAWLALAGMVLNAAWPLLANAKPSAPSSEICSATGAKHAPAAPARDLHASHCTLCPFGAERCAAIPYAGLVRLASVPEAAPVLTRSDAPRAPIALHAAAPPRAPPSLLI